MKRHVAIAIIGFVAVTTASMANATDTDRATGSLSSTDAKTMKKVSERQYEAARRKAGADAEAGEVRCKALSGVEEKNCRKEVKAAEEKAEATAKAAHEKAEADIKRMKH